MPKPENLLTYRKSLDEICTVPDKIISVYSLEKHVWADGNAEATRKARQPELQTIEEFQIDPVRSFLTDILRGMAAPYRPERRDESIGQGYWIQAEFGSGKSHLLCCLSALALGDAKAWDVIDRKEKKAGRGKRESLYRFWEEGLAAKSGKGKKGLFVIVKTLVGAGSGTVGMSDKGRRLTEYILDAAKEQIQLEIGKNVSLYPAELLADRFVADDLDRFRADLKKFLRDPRFFEEDEFEDVDRFVRDIQQNKSPEYKRSCGNKLWTFYTEYLKVQPHIVAETEEVMKHLVETIMAEGYSGVLLVLDELSLFMKNRDDDQRVDDEKTLVVLSNRLAKVHNLPVWTVCAAQQAIESKMGVKNIIADDRLKLVKLLENDKDYYDIVLARVREITDPAAIGNYFQHYRRSFSWPNSIGEDDFRKFFPFHKPALEVLRAVTYELTTARSAIHFMHQTLKHQIKNKGTELIRLWELFDETVRYEEDPSGVHAGLVAIKTKRESEYHAYEACRRQIDAQTKGFLKVYRDKAVKTIQTLFLYHIAHTRQQGLTPEEIANSVLIERDAEAMADENNQHYETLAENLKKELRQIVQNYDEDNRPRYRFDPIMTGVDPRDEFRKARDGAETNELMQQEAWQHLLALDEWPIRMGNKMTIDLSNGVRSIFRAITTFETTGQSRSLGRINDQTIQIIWQGRLTDGIVGLRDLQRMATDNVPLPAINTADTELDFAVYIGTRPLTGHAIGKLLGTRKDPRILVWTPNELTSEERNRLLDFAAYRKLVTDWGGKETEDALAVLTWVSNSLQTDLGTIALIVNNSFGRGRVDALNNRQMDFRVAGELPGILTPLIDRVLTATYESRDIAFDPPFIFKKEEGVKVLNGIVKTGFIPKGAKPNQDISAAQNFGFGLKIMKKSAEKILDTSGNAYVAALWDFIDDKLTDDGQPMKIDTLYKNFMGVGGPKDYGLTRRMVQIFLLCLAHDGRIRLGVGPRSGLAAPSIDYANLADIDFSTKILDALTEVQKLAKPENWEVLRPYAEKLLSEPIPTTIDDAGISTFRHKLREFFEAEQVESSRLVTKARGLFDTLKVANPYEKEVSQLNSLFSEGATGDDINNLLFALKTALGYQAFDSNTASQIEVDDLANRLKNYTDLKHFVGYDNELRAAYAYSQQIYPDLAELKATRKLQRKIAEKLADLRPYIDSDLKLRTEFIGHTGHTTLGAGETNTLGALIHEFTSVYMTLHDTVLDRVERQRRIILDLAESDGLKALRMLEKISALQPPIAASLEAQLRTLADQLFACPNPSRTSVEEQLRSEPQHECGLSFENSGEKIEHAQAAVNRAQALFNDALDRKFGVFLNPTIRGRLEQGQSDALIAKLLRCEDLPSLRTHLVLQSDAALVEAVNRYLKRIVVKHVRLADFKPSVSTIERGQIDEVAEEFRQYLEGQFTDTDAGEDTLSMLQLEA